MISSTLPTRRMAPCRSMVSPAMGPWPPSARLPAVPLSGAPGLSAITTDPSGAFVYVANAGSDNLSGYSAAAGVLTALSGSPFAAGTNPLSIAVDPLDPFVYVVNQGSNSISAFDLGSGGLLTGLNDSPFVDAGSPAALAVDPTGQFVYVANAATGTVSVFLSLDASTGDLSPVIGSPSTGGNSPAAIAISE